MGTIKFKYSLKNDGFCFLPKVFSKQNVHKAREGLWRVINGEYRSGRKPEARFWEPGGDPNSIIKIDKPHLCDDSIWNLITDKSFGQFLGKETDAEYVQVWHSQVVWKPYSKNQRGNAGWHRDSQYWPFWTEEGLYTAWIALSNVTIRSGPVRFLRGSNHWDHINGMDFFNQDIISQEVELKKTDNNKEIVNALLQKGEVSIHSSQTYHSSLGNKEVKPRVGMVVHFCTEKAKRIELNGKENKYLDQIYDPTIAPIIYEKQTESR